MEVKRVTLYHVVMRLKSPFETSFGKTVDRHCLIVKIEERAGEVGWGESPVDEGPWYSYETVTTAVHVLRDYAVPKLLEKRSIEGPEDFLKISRRVRGHRMAKAGVEMALWDLKAKLDKKPLYKLLGGVKSRIECGISIGIIGDEQRLLKAVGEFLSRGYKRVKIKIKPGWDTRPVELIRREYGEIPLQVDANAAYTLESSRTLKELDKHNLLMIEQPLDYDDLHDHAVLQSQLETPICLDESIKSIHDVKAAIKLGSCKVINIKPARVGGLTETKLIHDYTLEKGIPVWIGGMLETGIGRAYLVAAATLENVRYPSDIAESSRYWEEDVVEPPWTLEGDGTMKVPERRGIGVEVIEERVERSSKVKLTLG